MGKSAVISLFFCLIFIHTPGALEIKGTASWYGGHFHGKKTANGEIFNTYDLTAAHKELPFNTQVKVVNNDNGKSVTVRINDRGPYVGDRIIDLSYAAAQELEMVKQGVANVTLIIEGMDELIIYYGIYVGSYKTPKYANALMEKLRKQGFSAVAQKTESGIIRVLIPDVHEDDLIQTVSRLRGYGHKNILVKQN